MWSHLGCRIPYGAVRFGACHGVALADAKAQVPAVVDPGLRSRCSLRLGASLSDTPYGLCALPSGLQPCGTVTEPCGTVTAFPHSWWRENVSGWPQQPVDASNCACRRGWPTAPCHRVRESSRRHLRLRSRPRDIPRTARRKRRATERWMEQGPRANQRSGRNAEWRKPAPRGAINGATESRNRSDWHACSARLLI